MPPPRPHSRQIALVLAALIVVFPASPAAALTLVEAVDRALARSPEVEALASQIDVAKAREEFAGRGGQPQVGLDGGLGGQYSNLFGRGPATQFRRDVGASVTQRLWDFQRTGKGVEAAAHRTEVTTLDVELARDRLAFVTAEAYLNVVRRRLLLRQTQLDITYHRWLVDGARERVAKNQLAKARLTELEARLAPLSVDRIEQEAALARAAITLNELAGTTNELTLPPDVPADPRATREGRELDGYVNETLAAHPAMQRAALLIEAARKDLDAVKAGFYPALDANVSSRYLDEAEGLRGLQWDNKALLRLNWSLFGEGTPARVREAEAALKVAEAQRAQTRQELTLDLRRYAATLRALTQQERVLQEYQTAAKFSMEAGMAYFKRSAHFSTDMLALADLIHVRYQSEANLISNHIDRQLTELRLLQAEGHLVPALKKAAKR